MNPEITVELLPKTGDRDDFLVRAVGPGDTDYPFGLSITRTVLTIWQAASAQAATELAETLTQSHGTARAFPTEGFWFDSYNSADSVEETRNIIRNRGWQVFLHPAARESLGAALFNALRDLDAAFSERHGRPFLKSLDVLFEPAQALEDLESEAGDNAHFIYRICILSGIIDRFDFDRGSGSLNGLEEWLTASFGVEEAARLTTTFRMIKRLRKQYPIHEQYEVDAAGERQRRAEIVRAEQFFELGDDTASNWHRVLTRYTDDIQQLSQVLADTAQ